MSARSVDLAETEEFVSRNNAFYAERLALHGASHLGIDFRSPAAMATRFEQLFRVREGDGPFTILDYGCAYGAFYGWLSERVPEFRYVGYDLSPELLERARRLWGGRPNFEVRERFEELPCCDYAVAGGLFNLRFGYSDDEWMEYVRAVLERLARLGHRAFAFNALSNLADADRRRPDLFYSDPAELFAHCTGRYSRRVALHHDYLPWDFTIVVRKDPE